MRDEVQILKCGCKIGRTKAGMWVYDYLCDIHVKLVRKRGKYSFEKACKLTEKLNKNMKKKLNLSSGRNANEASL